MKAIITSNAPGAIGPYTQGFVSNGMIFTSGQIPLAPLSGQINGTTIEEQTEQACKNVIEVVKAGGGKAESIIKTTCFLSNMDDFTKFNSVYEKFFISKPARSCVAVKTLPKNVLCEIEAVAEVSE